jgi:hypothetical protein
MQILIIKKKIEKVKKKKKKDHLHNPYTINAPTCPDVRLPLPPELPVLITTAYVVCFVHLPH